MSQENQNTEETAKWQPVMLVKQQGRLECGVCGSLAIFVCLEESEDEDDEKFLDYTAWCQSCFSKAQREEIERE